jgi:hypothetical protein
MSEGTFLFVPRLLTTPFRLWIRRPVVWPPASAARILAGGPRYVTHYVFAAEPVVVAVARRLAPLSTPFRRKASIPPPPWFDTSASWHPDKKPASTNAAIAASRNADSGCRRSGPGASVPRIVCAEF